MGKRCENFYQKDRKNVWWENDIHGTKKTPQTKCQVKVLYVHIFIYPYISVYTYTLTHAYTYMHTHIRTHIHIHILITYQPSVKSVRESICLRFSYRPSDEGARSVEKKPRANTSPYRPNKRG